MRILLDENLPADFAALVTGHSVDAVTKVGWTGIRNGDLLRLAARDFEVFVTMDRNIEHQQNLSRWKLRIIVLPAPSNRLPHFAPLAPALMKALRKIKPGQLLSIGS